MGRVALEASTRVLADIARQPESMRFQEAALQGRFMLPRCRDCGQTHWYPRALCPFCFSEKVEWQDSSGRGTVYSYTLMRRSKPVYAIAYVALEEGPAMMSNIIGCDLDAIRIGMAVQVVFHATSNGTLVPMFKPVV